jgi:poly(A) polymerase
VVTDSVSARLLHVLVDAVAEWEHPVWFVGGTVRDRELGVFSPDIDVVTSGDPATLAERVSGLSGRPWFPLSHEFGAYRVVGEAGGVRHPGGRGEGHLDVVSLRGGSIEADLSLRDFTMNAMALPVTGGSVIDPFGGIPHLKERRLVPVSPTIFADDPLRLLRAPRFVHVLGLSLDEGLRDRIRAEAHLAPEAAPERVLTEFVATLGAGRSADAVRLWGALGLLDVLLPEVTAMKGVGQSGFHHHDVYGHTLETMERLDEVMEKPGRWYGSSWQALEERMADPVDGVMSRPVALRLGALLHDVAKPQTRAVDDDGRVLFWGHTELGGPLAERICARMRCSASASSLIRAVVERHLDVGFLQHDRPPSPRETVRFLWRSEPWEPEVIMVSLADRLATRGPKTEESYIDAHHEAGRRLMEAWRARQEHGVPRPPVDGEVLMERLGLGPGPLLGQVLQSVRLAWEAGELRDREEALALARSELVEMKVGADD